MTRVLTTQEAKDAINQIRQIIDGGLNDQITKLDTNGKKLSEPNVWDGPLATQFRNETWPSTHKALDDAKNKLTELQKQLQTIANNIAQAGGGSAS